LYGPAAVPQQTLEEPQASGHGAEAGVLGALDLK
jgi:hypothetical protein